MTKGNPVPNAETLTYYERSIHTNLGTIVCIYGPPSKLTQCSQCLNRNKGRYRIDGKGILCLQHARKWAFEQLIGEDNLSDAMYGRAGGDASI